MIIPLFDNTNYIEKSESWDYLTSSIHELLQESSERFSVPTLSDMIYSMILLHQSENYLIYFSTPFNELPYYKHDRFGKERLSDITSSIETIQTNEILKVRTDLTLRPNLDSTEDNEIYAIMDYRSYNIKSALFSIGNTIFICVVLVSMLHFFTEDINELIVTPIEKMMKQVMEMAKNPESVTMTLTDNTKYETAIVHNAIVKIGALLSLVFRSLELRSSDPIS